MANGSPDSDNVVLEPFSGSGKRQARTAARFREIIYGHYRNNPRSLPWRETDDPYCIFVSEFMLQQTQVERVRQKYGPFLTTFPDYRTLAQVPLRDVLGGWRGLGYNRRAVALQSCARRVTEEFRGQLPSDSDLLVTFPGIGPATAGAICAFAFRKPAVFVETNIRRVFLHFFFRGRDRVRDGEIFPLVAATLDRADPRTWYYALMDYGVMLKRTCLNPNRKSAHYTRQAPFDGSNRQIRGEIVRLLIERAAIALPEIVALVGQERERIEKNLFRLQREGLVTERDGRYFIP